MIQKKENLAELNLATQLVLSARNGVEGSVNPPVVRASTVQFNQLEALTGEHDLPTRYGIRELVTVRQLHEMIALLEQSEGCVSTSSGLSAISLLFDAFLEQGDDVAITDNIYLPTREYADEILLARGHRCRYIPVCAGKGITTYLTPETRVVMLEIPGSQTYEIEDLPAVVKAIRQYPSKKPIVIAVDNTWSAGVYYKPLLLGADISLQAGTKYLAGHSDVLFGLLAASGETLARLRTVYDLRGDHLSPDDAYLAIRGIRTLFPRLEWQQRSMLTVAKWLQADPRVDKVCCPALTCHPQHALWQRDFSGATSLFSFFTRQPPTEQRLKSYLHDLKVFRMGFSWGGFESLMIPTWPQQSRVTDSSLCCHRSGQLFRLHVGLEHPDDLIDDLDQALNRFDNQGGHG